MKTKVCLVMLARKAVTQPHSSRLDLRNKSKEKDLSECEIVGSSSISQVFTFKLWSPFGSAAKGRPWPAVCFAGFD